MASMTSGDRAMYVPDSSVEECPLKRPRNTDSDRCVICFTDTVDDLVTCPTLAGYQTLLKAANVLKDHVYITLKPFFDVDLTKVFWHRSCHRKYAHEGDKRAVIEHSLVDGDETSGTPTRTTTSSVETTQMILDNVRTRSRSFAWEKNLCIICQQRKYKGDAKVHMCQTLPSSKKLKEAATFHNDQASVRILSCIDLVAGDGVYHHACCRSYISDHDRCKRRGESPSSSVTQSSSEDERNVAIFYRELLSMVIGDSKVVDMNAVTALYNGITGMSAKNMHIRELLEHNLSQVIEFTPPFQKNKAVLVYSKHIDRGSLVQRIVDFIYTEQSNDNLTDSVSHGIPEEHIIYYAAKKIRTAILERGKGIEVGDNVSDNEVTKCAESLLVPELTSLVRFVVDPAAADEMSNEYSSEMFHRTVVSIAQDIVHVTTSGRQKMPKHIVLACDLYYSFQSEMLIQILSRLGHCVSYDSVKRHITALADAQSRKDVSRCVTIPSNIEPYSPGRLVQHVVDNLDFREETLYGRTTHVTSQIVVQKATPNSREIIMVSATPSRSRTLQVERQIHLHVTADQNSVKLPKVLNMKSHVNKTSVHWYRPSKLVTIEAEKLDMAWTVCRAVHCLSSNQSPELQTIPSWKAFNVCNSMNTANQPDTVGYLPLYDGSSQDPSTIRTLMVRAQERTAALCQPETVVACDLGIYQIARKLKELEPQLFSKTVVRIGVFHLHMKFIEVIGDRYGKAGLDELLSRSGLYGENTVKMILLGKAYNKAVRSAKLIYEVCFRLIFAEFSKEDDNSDIVNEINERARAFTSQYDSDDRSTLLEQLAEECLLLSNELTAFIAKKSLQSSTFMFWAELWKMLGILLRLIRADRECDFMLHLSAVAECMPYMFAFDKHNYARWLSVYLADMNSLKTAAPTVYQELLTGRALSVTGKAESFNAVSLDMRLEQSLNRQAKGSLKGISTNPNARDKFLLTAHHMADMHSAVAHMCGLSGNVTYVKEGGKKQIYRDEVDVRRLLLTLSGKMLNPFTTDGLDLIQISNRRKAPEAVRNASADAHKIGTNQMDDFVKERLDSNMKAMSDPIRRNKIATFRTAECKVRCPANAVKPAKPHGTFSSLFQAKTTVEAALQEELTDEYPESLFRPDGTFIKKDKSLLMKALEHDLPDCAYSFPNVESADMIVIYDGMALIHSLIKSFRNVRTFGEVARIFLATVLRLPNEVRHITNIRQLRIDVVMDRYDECSTKDMERQQRARRKGKAALCALPTLVTGHQQPCPADFAAFLELSSNKNQLIKFLTEQMLVDAPLLLQDQQTLVIGGGVNGKTFRIAKQGFSEICDLHADLEEADQRLMLHMKHAVEVDSRKYGLFVATDTDIAVISIGSFHLLGTCEVYQSINSRLVPLHVIWRQLGSVKAAALVAFHAITGCDTTSHLSCRKSKKTLWVQACKSPEILQGMASFGQTPMPPHVIDAWVTKFICNAYGCTTSFNDLGSARISLFKTLTKTKIDTDINRLLPPTEKALLPHLQRAAYQTYISRQCCSPPPVILPDVTKFGWRREDTVLIPVTVVSILTSAADADEQTVDFSGTIDNDPSLDNFSSSDTDSDSEAETSCYNESTDSDN